jgi:hypothetical protein
LIAPLENSGRLLDVWFLIQVLCRALVGDLHQPLALLGVQRASSVMALDVIDHADLGFAGRAVVAWILPWLSRTDTFSKDLLEIGIKPDRHRRAGTETGQQ